MRGKKLEATTSSNTTNDPIKHTRSGRCVKYNSDYTEKCAKKRQRQNMMYQVKKALKKCAQDRTKDDNDLLANCEDLVKHVDVCERNRLITQAHQEIVLDESELLIEKCRQLADLMVKAKSCVFYTGAGISTSASIPDYRGPNGLWTLLEKGQQIELPDFTRVVPTYSHMALAALVQAGLVAHIVSQNCDGLHVRSGMDREKLSELHGNCFVEFCTECSEEYVRLFDVTERSSFRKHVTGRFCPYCMEKVKVKKETYPLRDSIIHFGEKLRDGSPYNWDEARTSVKSTNLIITLGTSLKVLKHYACLWPKKKTTDTAIVCIQWTPKDKMASMKINGYCDQVMKYLIENLNEHGMDLEVDGYDVQRDPIFKLAVDLKIEEFGSMSKPILKMEGHNNVELVDCDAVGRNDNVKLQTMNTDSWFTKSFKARKKTKSSKAQSSND